MTKVFPNVQARRASLANSIAEGKFLDVTYYLFSKRLVSNKVGKPRAVHANSIMMKSGGDHFRSQLAAGFSTRNEVYQETDTYGYDSDSDLDDESVEEDDIGASSTPEYVKYEELVLEGKGKDKATATADIDIDPKKPDSQKESSKWEASTVIMVPDVAAQTWQALVYYIYEGRIRFAPLKSRGASVCAEANASHLIEKPGEPPLCSPKSVYRLADIVGMDGLKRFAIANIRSQLSQANILEEVFSRFTSLYSDVLAMQVEYLCREGLTANVMLLLSDKVDHVARGELTHAGNVLKALLQRIPQVPRSEPASSLPDESPHNAPSRRGQLGKKTRVYFERG